MLLIALLNDCVTFSGFLALFWTVSIDYSFLPSCRHLLLLLLLLLRRCFNHVRVIPMPFLSFKAFFLQWNIFDDGIIDCNGILVIWRCFCDWNHPFDWLILSAIVVVVVAVVAVYCCTSFIAPFVFNHGIASSWLLNGPLLGPPVAVDYYYFIIGHTVASIWFILKLF